MPQRLKAEECILRNADAGAWLCFRAPRVVITAARTSDVLPALEQIESLARRHGWHAAGFISYEAAEAFDTALCAHAADDFPLLWFGLYEKAETFPLPDPDLHAYALGDFIPTVREDEYDRAIQKIKQHLHAGDSYQVNYTLRLRSRFEGDPWHLFLAMVRAQPSGYSAYIDTGRYAVCSASPELFFRLDHGCLTCKPMKGTVRRGRTTSEDNELAQWLQQSEKNRAENLMIVDMIRNDLGRVADTGSVRTPALFEVERHPTLWQMTSTVTDDCRKSWVEILSALFPCASITGAPKIRTTRIIRELEPDARHLYTGSIGHIAPDGFAQFNVAIRTALVDRKSGCAEYGAGGGIVIDSVSEDEYSEALLKARVFMEQPVEFSLLETMLWTPEEGYFLLEYHLRRLQDSAGYFGYSVDGARINTRLHECVRDYAGMPQRVRLLVDRNGAEEIQATPLSIPRSIPKIRVKLASSPVMSSNVFLYHKTTHRGIYEAARSNCQDCDDVLLWNERGELTESTIANLVVELKGRLITPPLNSGLLPGTFRQWLLDRQEVCEQILPVEEISRCTRIYLVNSVRKWQECILG